MSYSYLRHRLSEVAILIVMLVIAGCKKETTGTTTSTPPPPFVIKSVAPKAFAGSNLYVAFPADTATLKGIVIADEPNITRYEWRQLTGPAGVTFVNPNRQDTRIRNLQVGEYIFEFKITDSHGRKSSATVKAFVLQTGQKEIIFKQLEWGCPMWCSAELNNFNSFVPRGTPFKAFIKPSNSITWQLLPRVDQWNGTDKYYYGLDNERFYVSSEENETGDLDVKIQL